MKHQNKSGDAAITELLIRNGANINFVESRGRTALHWAVVSGHDNTVDALIKNGAAINIKDNDGKTPLDLAKDSRKSLKNFNKKSKKRLI